MKKLKYILPILFVITLFTSCSSDDDDPVIINETEGLTKVQEFTNATHTIEVYTKTGKFYSGYNDISLRIKNNTDDTYFENYTINWMPIMQMPSMSHSCPKSGISKVENMDTLYQGYLVFQMTNEDESGWSIKFMYNIDDTDYMAESNIAVKQTARQNVTTFMGSDETRYIISLVEPMNPEIAINNMKATLHKMETMMSFPVVEDYTITLDPRMPSMGNHTSPNNTDLTFNTSENKYNGDLSLTMTGYWVLNLKLLNQNNEVLKGETITEDTIQSTLYLEIEF